jgi:lycopene cyclase domain-containing protein
MTAEFSYLAFHVGFVLPVLAVLAVSAARRTDPGWGRTLWVGWPIVTFLALAYTTPWDNLLVARGVWRYGEGAVLATVWHAPVEEYAFFALQPALTTLWVAHLAPPRLAVETPDARTRLVGVAAAALVGLVGVLLLLTPATFYLGAILAWAAPVFGVQWTFGWRALVRAPRTMALGVLVPTAYLCAVDRIAIDAGVWTLSSTYTTGVTVLGLPVEEATFFLVTNCFVVQSFVLLRWVLADPEAAVPGVLQRYLPGAARSRAEVPR